VGEQPFGEKKHNPNSLTGLSLSEVSMSTVTKKELLDRIAEHTQAKRVSVKRIVQAFLDEITTELCKGNRLEFRDFGVFETRTRAARIAQNPKTLERVDVPVKRTVKFKMGRQLRENLSAPITKRAETK
jgi:integration host factor subunit beta